MTSLFSIRPQSVSCPRFCTGNLAETSFLWASHLIGCVLVSVKCPCWVVWHLLGRLPGQLEWRIALQDRILGISNIIFWLPVTTWWSVLLAPEASTLVLGRWVFYEVHREIILTSPSEIWPYQLQEYPRFVAYQTSPPVGRVPLVTLDTATSLSGVWKTPAQRMAVHFKLPSLQSVFIYIITLTMASHTGRFVWVFSEGRRES